MPQWCYVGTAPRSRADNVKKRLRKRGIGYMTKSHPSEIGDGVYGPATDFYVGRSRYYEAQNMMSAWEEEGVVIVILTAAQAGL